MSSDFLTLPRRATFTPKPPAPLPDCGLRSRLVARLLVSALLVAGLGGWAAIAQISAAVIASGVIVVDSSVKKVQHPYGGVIGKIFVRNGDRVDGGDLLIRLDDTQTRAALGVIVAQIIELSGRSARLSAERDGAD